MTAADKLAFAKTQFSEIMKTIRIEKSPVRVHSLLADLIYWWDEINKWEKILCPDP